MDNIWRKDTRLQFSNDDFFMWHTSKNCIYTTIVLSSQSCKKCTGMLIKYETVYLSKLLPTTQ